MSAAWWDGPLVGFDLETTGPDPDEARIVTACVVVVGDDGSTAPMTWLADPGVDIPEGATAVHGVTTGHARTHGFPARNVVAEVIAALDSAIKSGTPLVAFNAAYDFTVLDREARRYGVIPLTPAPVIDPFVLDKQADRYRRGKRTLTACAEHYGVQLDAAHTADADALAAVHIARAIPRALIAAGKPTPPADARVLHDGQVHWRREQCESLQEWLRRDNPTVVVDGTWPVHPVPEYMEATA